jgi:hypothetical protein
MKNARRRTTLSRKLSFRDSFRFVSGIDSTRSARRVVAKTFDFFFRADMNRRPVHLLLPTDVLAVTSANSELDRQFCDEIRARCRDRIMTLEEAESIVARREQMVSIREAAIHRAITGSNGSTRSLEAAADAAVVEAASKLPPPVSVFGFVAELEDRAVDIEVSLRAVRHQLAEVRRREAAVQAMERDAQVVMERARLLDESAREMLSRLRQKELEMMEEADNARRLSHSHQHLHQAQRHAMPAFLQVASPAADILNFAHETPARTRVTTMDSASQTDAAVFDQQWSGNPGRKEGADGREALLATALRQHELEAACLRQQQLWLLPRLEALRELEGRLRSFGLLEDAPLEHH